MTRKTKARIMGMMSDRVRGSRSQSSISSAIKDGNTQNKFTETVRFGFDSEKITFLSASIFSGQVSFPRGMFAGGRVTEGRSGLRREMRGGKTIYYRNKLALPGKNEYPTEIWDHRFEVKQ